MNKFSLKLLLICTLFFSFSFGVNAQVYGQALDVTYTPLNPAPGAHIIVNVKDVVGDLDKKQITWSLNGKVEKRGVGEKKFEFDLGPLGSVSSVTVSTDVLTKTIQIRPTEVDVVWESDGYVPPFYKGKSLRAYQGNVRIVAMPNFINSQGELVDRNKVVYNWKNGGVLNAAASGYGKSSVSYPSSVIPKALRISVEASSVDGSFKGGKEISIENVEPSILFYEDHPLYGVRYNNALNTTIFEMKNKEFRVTAFPLFFSSENKSDSKLKYSWSINGNPVFDQQFKDSVVLRQDANTPGQSSVSLQLDNSNEILQSYRSVFGVKFQP